VLASLAAEFIEESKATDKDPAIADEDFLNKILPNRLQ
jgi:hypothetical protein